MKYCPYCGADLNGGTDSFCTECGKPVKGRKTKARSVKKPAAEKRKREMSESPEDLYTEPKAVDETLHSEDEGYDGYYDDIKPIDENVQRQSLDKTVIKNIIIIIAGVIVAIGICVAAMYLI